MKLQFKTDYAPTQEDHHEQVLRSARFLKNAPMRSRKGGIRPPNLGNFLGGTLQVCLGQL